MMDSIYKKQNEPEILKCIAAQRKQYDKAKKVVLIKDILIVVLAILSIIASWTDNEMMTAIAFLLAGITSLTGKYIDIYVHKHKGIAADTQQYTDVTLYNFVLEEKTDQWGVIPSDLELAETISIVGDKDIDEVKNWYGDYSYLMPIEQVFCCQKENVRWDNKLRQEFGNLIISVIGLIVFVLFIVTFAINPSVIKVLCVISWMLPLIDFCYSCCRDLKKDIERIEGLKNICSKIEKSMSKVECNVSCSESAEIQQVRRELIELQKGIYEHRKTSTLIPNWFYKIKQKQYQVEEDKIASERKNLSSRK